MKFKYYVIKQDELGRIAIVAGINDINLAETISETVRGIVVKLLDE